MKGLVGDRVGELLAAKRKQLEQRHPILRAARERNALVNREQCAVVLGRNAAGDPVVLPERPRLEHLHVIGATGSGKTNFIEHLVRQDILHGRGVCVVDPHGNHPGSLYRSLLTWICDKGIARTRVIHLVDPNAPEHTIGFNPLDGADSGVQCSVIAEAAFEAFERIWGDEDGNSKPTIQRVLTAAFTALGEQHLTLAEARLLFDPEDGLGIRALVLGKLQDGYARDEIEWLHGIGNERTGRRDFRAEVVGPLNRIAKLVRTQAVRVIVGQTEPVIDLREAMDRGDIILANLSGGSQVYEQAGDLLGRLLNRFIFFHARRREHPERAFHLYLDECHRYLSGDVPNLLAEVRKYGVGVVLAHQWLAQLGRRDDPIREAVCKGPNIKAVFRIKDPQEAAELAEAVMPLDLEIPVGVLVQPKVVGHRRTLFRNSSIGRQQSRTDTQGRSSAMSISETEGTNTSRTETDSFATTDTTSSATTETRSHSITSADSYSHSDSTTAGRSSESGTSMSWNDNTSVSRVYSDPWLQLIPDSTAVSRGSGSGTGRFASSGFNSSDTVSDSYGHSDSMTEGRATSITEGRSYSRTTGKSLGLTEGTSRATTKGRTHGTSSSSGITTGTSASSGFSEGIEPIYANLPSAVHGKENVLYHAAQNLLSLPTGSARLAYVGEAGRVMSLINVPLVKSRPTLDREFNRLRKRILASSASALPIERAIKTLEERELRLIAEAQQISAPPEPEDGFRVPAPKGIRSR